MIGLLPAAAMYDEPGFESGAALHRVTTAATLLLTAGIDYQTVESHLRPKALPLPTSVEIPFSASGKRSLEDAMREANQMGTRSITTGHVLLGLLQADGTAAATLLHAAGLRLHAVRLQVEADVAAGVEGEPPRAPSNRERA